MGIDPVFAQTGLHHYRGYGLFANVDAEYFSAHGSYKVIG
jgi:hypothetical protein